MMIERTRLLNLASLFPAILGSPSGLTRRSWLSVFYKKHLLIYPSQSKYSMTHDTWQHSSKFWVSDYPWRLTKESKGRKGDLGMTVGTKGLTCFLYVTVLTIPRTNLSNLINPCDFELNHEPLQQISILY